MKMNIHFSIGAVLGLLAIRCLAGASSGLQISPAELEVSPVKPAEAVYKNIQQLKGIPADQIIPGMQFITYSLGVECSFCHVEGAFDRDDKKQKLMAREMMQMMQTINRVNFHGRREVSCFTCHRGSSRPLTTPLVAQVGTEAPFEHPRDEEKEEPAPANMPSPEKILAAFTDALGGASAIGQLSTRVEKGTIRFGEKKLPIEISSKDPGRRITLIHMPDGDSVTAYDTTFGWTHAQNRRVLDIAAPEVASARLETDLHLPIRLNQLFSDLRSDRAEKIGDHDTFVVSGYIAGKLAANLYFDEHSGLLLRMVRYVDTPFGFSPTQIDFEDYRSVGGVKMAFQRVVARPGSRFTIQIEDVRDNVPVGDAQFARPQERSSPQNPSSP
jgi:hypothetical protein